MGTTWPVKGPRPGPPCLRKPLVLLCHRDAHLRQVQGNRLGGVGVHQKPTALAHRVGELETQGPLEGSEAQVGQSFQREDGGRGGLGDALERTGLVWAAQLDLGHKLPHGEASGALSKGRVHSYLGNVLRSSGTIPGVTTGTTTPGLYPPIPWTTLHALFVIQEPLRAHLVPPFIFTGGEIKSGEG